MSYCVNCGVELDESASKCALCSTPVINPNIRVPVNDEKPFSDELHIPRGIKKRFIAMVLTVAIVIPDIVMFFLNVFFIKNGYWSIYVFFTSCLVWILGVVPLFVKKVNPYIVWGTDSAAVLLYTYVMHLTVGGNSAVFKSIICIMVITSLSVFVTIAWLRTKKRHWTSVVVLELCLGVVASFLSGGATALFTGKFTIFVIGTVISVCLLVLTAFFIYCNRSKSVRAWLNKVLSV